MKVAIMQPYLFPYIGYYQLVSEVDQFVFLDDVNYINKGWINRNNILVNGSNSMFTFPLKSASQNTLIKEVQHAIDDKFRAKFLKTLEFSYKKAPFFYESFNLIKDIVSCEYSTIGEIAKYSITAVFKYLDIDVNVVNSSSAFVKDDLKGQSRIIHICKSINATSYVNPINGKDLYKHEDFEKENILLFFLKTLNYTYTQFSGKDFVPNLSIIDILMFNSPDETRNLLTKYELIK